PSALDARERDGAQAARGREGHERAARRRGQERLRLLQGRDGDERQHRAREDDGRDDEVAHPRERVPRVPQLLRASRSRSRSDRHLFGGQMKRALFIVLVALLAACGGGLGSANSPADLSRLRSEVKSSTDGEVVGRWLLDEMVAPGGTAQNAADARARLDKTRDKAMWAGLAQGIYDETHGDPRKAAQGYIGAL